MDIIQNYNHEIGAHCESGTLKNLIKHEGVEVTEKMLFGIGSGIFFAYLPFVKTVSAFPVVALRQPICSIVKNVSKDCGIGLFIKEFPTTQELLKKADSMIEAGKPVAVSVDLFYMDYLPKFMQVHAPAHFIALIGKDENSYAVSDPYGLQIAKLSRRNLELALKTNARLAPQNLLYFIEKIPEKINWKRAIVSGIRRTTNRMLMIPVVRNILPFLGIEGIKRFARSILNWPEKFKGFRLREGLLFLAVTFEEQGTGGGAFRLMYGAFLEEVAQMFNSSEFMDLSTEMIQNGKEWREASRLLVKVGKMLPVYDKEYPDWMESNGKILKENLEDLSRRYMERAECERKLMHSLQKAVSRI